MDAVTLTTRLGQPEELAAAAVHYRARGFLARHPVLTFIVAPIPVALAATFCSVLALVGILLLTGSEDASGGVAGESITPAAAGALAMASWALRYLPFLLCVVFFCRVAQRTGHTWRWPLAATGLVAVLAAIFAVTLVLPTGGPGTGSLTVGFSLPPAAGQWLQALTTIAVGTLLVARSAAASPERWSPMQS